MSQLPGISRVDIVIPNNAWWTDAFQFGDPTDLTWSFTGKSFLLDVKLSPDDTAALLALSSVGGTLVVDDTTQRILHMLVDDHLIRSSLPAFDATGKQIEYHYDLIMVDNSSTQRDMLMYGELRVGQGVTLED